MRNFVHNKSLSITDLATTMITMNTCLSLLFLSLLANKECVNGWAYGSPPVGFQPRPSIRRTSTLSMRRGRGNLKREVDSSTTSPSRGGSSDSINWIPLAFKAKSVLPEQENKVALIDTNLPTLKNAATNPTGAVSVVNYDKQVYCFSSSCPSCKIPMTKASVSAAASSAASAPVIQCGFCKAKYNLKDGQRMESNTDDDGGLFGGVVKSIFAAKDSGPLPVYRLGEKGGKLLIALD